MQEQRALQKSLLHRKKYDIWIPFCLLLPINTIWWKSAISYQVQDKIPQQLTTLHFDPLHVSPLDFVLSGPDPILKDITCLSCIA